VIFKNIKEQLGQDLQNAGVRSLAITHVGEAGNRTASERPHIMDLAQKLQSSYCKYFQRAKWKPCLNK
jgi:hypothetical protein